MTPLARWLVGGIAAIILLAAGSAPMTASDEATKPDPDSATLVARGKVVYVEQCARCHGANLEGEADWRRRLPNGRLRAPPHDVKGHTWHHSDEQLFDMVKNGTAGLMPGYETDMPAYKETLSDVDISAVLSFIESTWPADIRTRQQSISRRPP
jgi:mono/diheme cytochrome c family protein